MISRLRGQLVGRTPDGFVLDVNGVGYLLAATPGAVRAAEGGGEAVVETYLHVREDALQLFGFATALELTLFERLISVSGIGPKVALAVLSGIEPEQLVRAIRSADVARLIKIPGVGRKTAERLIVELRDRLPEVGGAEPTAADDADDLRADLLSALGNLGYQRASVEKTVDKVLQTSDSRSFEVVLRQVLRSLAG